MHIENPSKYLLGVVVAIGVCAVLGLGYVAYAAPSTPSKEAPFTSSLVEHDDLSFVATAKRGEARTTVIVQRTHRHHEEEERVFIRDPEIDSPYEYDVVIYNRHGLPIAVSAGGNIPVIDPETGDVVGTQPLHDFRVPATLSQAEQLEDLQSVIDLTESLRQNKNIGDQFRWEIRAIQSLGQWGIDHANDFIEGRVQPESIPNIKGAYSALLSFLANGISEQMMGSDYTHQAYIRWANCCITFGQHSAVLVNVYDTSTGAYITTVSSSNHGRDASDPSMSTVSGCPKSWSGRTTAIPNFQPYVNTDNGPLGTDYDAGGCNTSYGLTSGTHVCNDDSLAQYLNVKYNTQASWLTCSDSSLRTTAPSCN